MKQRPFLALWTLAVAATALAFVVHLALRGRTVDLGYKLGKARAEQARLREVKRVLSLEAASFETPQRVEMVARSLLGMTPPPPERVVPMRTPASTLPPDGDNPRATEEADLGAAKAAASAAAGSASAQGGSAPPPDAANQGAAPPSPPLPRALPTDPDARPAADAAKGAP